MKYSRYILLLGLTALLIGGTFWARNKSRDEVCSDIRIEVSNSEGTTFVTPNGVLAELNRKHIVVKGRPVWQINLEDLEHALRQSQYIESVECMFVDGGILVIKVDQIVPVLRVFDGNKSYYVNKDGKKMEASATFTADVPVVEGHFTDGFSPVKLLPMIQYVEKDAALKRLVSMYCFKDSNNIIIAPSIEGPVINMGSCNDYESKFRKLMLFYNKVMPVKGWTYYDTISVKWDYQVVATRRDKLKPVERVYDPNEDELPDNVETMQITDNSAPTDDGAAKPSPKADESKKKEAKAEKPAAPAPANKNEKNKEKKNNN